MAQLDAGQQYLQYRTIREEQRDIVRERVERRCPLDSQDIIEMLGLDQEIDDNAEL